MDIKTKFSLGDAVVGISSSTVKRLVGCFTCNRTGKIHVGDEEFICPKCGGSSCYPQHAGEKWYVSTESVIGNIRTEHTSPNHLYSGDREAHIQYMLKSTGIGGGRLWSEEDLFATREEAEIACDIRNLVLPQDEPGVEQKEQLVSVPYTFEHAE